MGRKVDVQTVSSNTSAEPRYPELDSLRGIAALTVVFHHFRLMWESRVAPAKWVAAFNFFTYGHEAVMLFFLLSGFVLSLPYLRGKSQPYPVFLLRRILRLYGPYLFALAISVAGAAIWHGSIPGGTWANIAWSQPVSGKLLVEHIFMLGNYNWNQFNLTFWTLVIEMRISIVFPFLYLLVRRVGPTASLLLATIGSILADIALQRWPLQQSWSWTAQFAMIFIAGIVLAESFPVVSAWYRSLGPAGRLAFLVVTICSYQYGHHLDDRHLPHFQFGLDQPLYVLGATGYIILALNAPWARTFLSTTIARFLGRISFSLYLIHSTVLLAMTRILEFKVSVPLQFFLYIAITVLLSYFFCLGVEEPFLRLSRRVGMMARVRASAEPEKVSVGSAV
jgi:peptidoglycan/LPS O-acetylase OafA/YrhL